MGTADLQNCSERRGRLRRKHDNGYDILICIETITVKIGYRKHKTDAWMINASQ